MIFAELFSDTLNLLEDIVLFIKHSQSGNVAYALDINNTKLNISFAMAGSLESGSWKQKQLFLLKCYHIKV